MISTEGDRARVAVSSCKGSDECEHGEGESIEEFIVHTDAHDVVRQLPLAPTNAVPTGTVGPSPKLM